MQFTVDMPTKVEERRLWKVLQSFESLAICQYEANVPAIDTTQKRELLHMLDDQIGVEQSFDPYELDVPIKNLLKAATICGECEVLIMQGLILELLAKALYEAIEPNEGISIARLNLCSAGITASKAVSRQVLQCLATNNNRQQFERIFMTVSKPLFLSFSLISEDLDIYIGSKLGMSFTDVLADFVSELVPICSNLGIERRKTMGYLTNVLMGI